MTPGEKFVTIVIVLAAIACFGGLIGGVILNSRSWQAYEFQLRQTCTERGGNWVSVNQQYTCINQK